MKTLFYCIWILLVTLNFGVRAAAPNVTPLGALSASLRAPARVAADANGNLYVTDPAAGRVIGFDAFGQQMAVYDGFAGPLAIAVASDGRIYLSEEKNGSVSVFDAQWDLLYRLGAGANEFQLPGHLAVDPLAPDTVCVSDGKANLIRVFTGTNQVAQFGGAGTGNGKFDFPAGVSVRANGEVLVVDQNNDRIQVFTNSLLGWQYSRKFPLGSGGMFGGPSGRSQALFVDAAGRVFVADAMQGLVKVFDAGTGLSLGSLGDFGGAPGQLNLPLGLVLDSLNRLCVASANNSRVELFGVDDFLHLSVQAVNGNLAAGNNLVISALAGGAYRAGFQWQKNGMNVDGATNATLTVAGATAGDSGNYSVVFSTSSGTVTSSVTPVSVLASPKILVGPVSQKILVGATAGFGVIATGSALNFQWQFNGQNLPGATNANLTLAGAQAAQSGQYAVRVGNAVGTQTAAPAVLAVITPPLVMDMLSSAPQADQTLQLTLNVEPGFVYELQATTDFVQWDSIANVTANGLLDFIDTDSTNHLSRFYRLSWKP